jgi:hypothetical protein
MYSTKIKETSTGDSLEYMNLCSQTKNTVRCSVYFYPVRRKISFTGDFHLDIYVGYDIIVSAARLKDSPRDIFNPNT